MVLPVLQGTEERLPSCSKGGHLLCRLLSYGSICVLHNGISGEDTGFFGVGSYDCDSWYVQMMMLFDLVPNGSSSLSDIN